MQSYKTLSWSAILISAVLLILPRVIPICNGLTAGGKPMQCHYAYQAEFLFSLLALLLSASLLVLKTAEARKLGSFLLVLLGIIIAILPQPWVIGICEQGACVKTAFFSTIIGGLLGFAGALLIWLISRQEKEDD